MRHFVLISIFVSSVSISPRQGYIASKIYRTPKAYIARRQPYIAGSTAFSAAASVGAFACGKGRPRRPAPSAARCASAALYDLALRLCSATFAPMARPAGLARFSDHRPPPADRKKTETTPIKSSPCRLSHPARLRVAVIYSVLFFFRFFLNVEPFACDFQL